MRKSGTLCHQTFVIWKCCYRKFDDEEKAAYLSIVYRISAFNKELISVNIPFVTNVMQSENDKFD